MLCAAKTGRTRLQKVSNFQEPILRTQLFFYLLISRKAWTSFMVMTASCDSKKPSRHWQKTSTKNRHMVTYTLPSPKSRISLCAFLEQLLRAIWCAVSWATVLFLPPQKLSTFMLCIFESQHPELIFSCIPHPIISQLDCSEIHMRINPGHGTWEEVLLPCVVLVFGNISSLYWWV